VILLIGDAIGDVYLEGPSYRQSPEAPVPVILNPKKRYEQGGAMNVANNLRALGSAVELMTNTKVPTKTRILANGKIVARIDEESYEPFSPVIDNYKKYDCVVLSDYNKGSCHEASKIISEANIWGRKVFVDPKRPFATYKGAYLIKANQAEYEAETKEALPTTETCKKLCGKYGFAYIVVTLGKDGMFVCGGPDINLSFGSYGYMRDVVDVTGAGDVVLAAIVHYHMNGDTMEDACRKANKLAGISVSKFGTYVLSAQDIREVEPAKGTVVFTNGCFDILHPGHIHLLRESKKLGGRLIVGINSDESVRRLKGPTRPINGEQQRKAMLEALDIVDEVIIFHDDTPRNIITGLKPKYITKGGDYKPEDVVGNDIAIVHIIPTLPGYSTTGIINGSQ
jgi:D-beta-D-heptose 7-phosphate kinase/D-beta-D-heptose 1-phosphate adenosyltransferase